MDLINSILKSIDENKFLDKETIADSQEGISLLALKNEALLSYISNLLLIAASQSESNEQVFDDARRRSIEQRVVLEKGVKGLEAKISYQIDKVLRAYRRSMEEAQQPSNDDSDSDMDPTQFKPNAGDASDSSESEQEDKKYVAPRIQPTLPAFEKQQKPERKKRDFAMEEYIQESGEAPVAEPSIGSQIMDSGRGGERTSKELKRDREIQQYEESNFTRISNVSSKRARKEAAQRQRDATANTFFGEDWRFLDGINGEQRGRKNKNKKRKM